MEKNFEKKIVSQEKILFQRLKTEIASLEADFSEKLFEISKGLKPADRVV